jgi:hypothetical protein
MMKRIWGNKIILGFVRSSSRAPFLLLFQKVMFLLVGGIVAIIWLRFFPPWGDGIEPTTAPAVKPNTTRF